MQNNKKRVLFICENNSGRSQMAEGLLRHFYGDIYEVYSAGIHPKPVNKLTIKVLAEIGVDISCIESKNLDKFKGMDFDCVVILCDGQNACPFFIGGKKFIHHKITDPALYKDLKDSTKTEMFRMVRDEIKEWIIEEFNKKKLKS